MSIDNTDSNANEWCFSNFENEENLISFSSNLHYWKKEDRNFTTAIHKNKADKRLVLNSQDKGHADEDKLNECAKKEVTLLFGIAKLSSYLKPKDN